MWAYSLSTSAGTPSTIIDVELSVYDFNSSEKHRRGCVLRITKELCTYNNSVQTLH